MHTAVMLRSCSVPSILLLLLPLATALRVGTGASSPLLRSAGVSRCASPHCTVATTAPAAAAPSDEVTDKDDVADMRGVDKKLHQLVEGMRQRGAGPP